MSVKNPRSSMIRLSSSSVDHNIGHIILEGYLLKKKQKRIQGFARRYFRLYSSGIITYAVNDIDSVRDHVNLRSSVWLSNVNRKTITIDGGTSTWHIKFQSIEDYSKWLKNLRSFLEPLPASSVPLETVAEHNRQPTENIEQTLKLIDLLEFDLKNLKNTSSSSSVRTPPSSRSREQLHHSNNNNNGGLLNIFHKSPKLNNSHDDLSDIYQNKQFEAVIERILNSTNEIKNLQNDLYQQFNDKSHINYRNDTMSSQRQFNPPRLTPSRTSSVNEFEFFDAPSSFGEAYEYADADEDQDQDNDDDGDGDLVDDDDDVDKEGNLYDSINDDEGNKYQKFKSKYGVMQLPSRSQLPSPISGDEIGLLGVLKKNVGKDLTTISFPVSFNEPLSLLQKVAEDFEYVNLVEKAIKSKSSLEKMVYIAAFCVSSYSCTQFRSTRKPFNPLLGETYELILPQFAFFAEKVNHHPPLVAAYAKGKGWSYVATSGVKQKFWGKSMEIIPIGNSKLILEDSGDVFTWKKPSSFIRNLVMSSPYLEHTGNLDIKNERTGETSTISFKEGSFFSGESSRGFIEGYVNDKNSENYCKLSGKWSTSFVRHLINENNEIDDDKFQKLWESKNQFPSNCEDFYGFSKFGVKLNELINEKGLPLTDTRHRPDQRALENGDVNKADDLKNKLEQIQRDKRNNDKQSYDNSRVKWFKKVSDFDWSPIMNEDNSECAYFDKRLKVSENNENWDNDLLFQL